MGIHTIKNNNKIGSKKYNTDKCNKMSDLTESNKQTILDEIDELQQINGLIRTELNNFNNKLNENEHRLINITNCINDNDKDSVREYVISNLITPDKDLLNKKSLNDEERANLNNLHFRINTVVNKRKVNKLKNNTNKTSKNKSQIKNEVPFSKESTVLDEIKTARSSDKDSVRESLIRRLAPEDIQVLHKKPSTTNEREKLNYLHGRMNAIVNKLRTNKSKNKTKKMSKK
jgi:hypothetical protein